MDQEGEEKGVKLKENQEGKAGKKLWRRKTSVSRRKRRRRRQRKSRKMPLERKKMPRERMDKQEDFVKSPCRPKTVLSKKYHNLWSFWESFSIEKCGKCEGFVHQNCLTMPGSICNYFGIAAKLN